MNQNEQLFPHALMIALLGGATLGGFAAVFTASLIRKEFRNGLRSLASRLRPKAVQASQADDGVVRAAFV